MKSCGYKKGQNRGRDSPGGENETKSRVRLEKSVNDKPGKGARNETQHHVQVASVLKKVREREITGKWKK